MFADVHLSSATHPREDSLKTNINAIVDSSKTLVKTDSSAQGASLTDTTKISKDALEEEVKYAATDSIRFEVDSQMVYLYGKAKVNYTNIELKADYIELSLKKNIVFAVGVPDSTGKIMGKPEFKDGDQEFKSDKITYNFETKKGKIINVTTKQDEGYLHGDKVKKDSSNNIYMQHGTYTTCNLEHPHFWFEINKVKVIKDDKIVTGPADLKIAGVPTPLAMPFGFFPNKKGKANGLILPRPFDSEALGFGLSEGGYYWGINDNMDLTLTGDVFARGSFNVNAKSNYIKRYKYNGNFGVRYAYVKTGEKGFPGYGIQRDVRVNWSHNQDRKANPSSVFSASVDAGKTSNLAQRDVSLYLKNSMSSRISYSKSFLGTPFSLTVSAQHSQNTGTKAVEIDLPNALFNMQSINPLGTKLTVGKAKWISDLRLNYSTAIDNRVSGSEDEIFNIQGNALNSTLGKMRNGAKHNSSLATNVKLLKYFVLTPSLSYDELWYLQTTKKYFDQKTQRDSSVSVQGFSRANNTSFNTTFRTVLYGTYLFKRGNIKGFRHTITPTASYSYNPGLTKQDSYYNADQKKTVYYSRYADGILGAPSTVKSSVVNMSVTNFLEMKYKSKKDTLGNFQKVRLLDELSANTSYDFNADSMNWRPLNIVARTVIFNMLNVNFNSTYHFYNLNQYSGAETGRTMVDASGKLARLTSSTLNITYSLKSKNNKKVVKESKSASKEELEEINRNRDQYIDFNVPWQFFLSYNLIYSKSAFVSKYTQTLLINGDISLTPKWKITFSSGWDFTHKDITMPTLNFYRDLHCWEMNFNVIPYGPTKQYSIGINVKASVLQDLKLSRRRSWYDFK
jgi:lipopolysaccharide assembly outer membrane protein LptD (OstA)